MGEHHRAWHGDIYVTDFSGDKVFVGTPTARHSGLTLATVLVGWMARACRARCFARIYPGRSHAGEGRYQTS